ncbi:MAG: hypothetical protein Q9182_006932 [Xanthomendoza sp. 2 TL-2023]
MATAHPQNVHPDDTRFEKEELTNHRPNGNTTGIHNDSGDSLTRLRTAGSLNISPELFEKLYLSPENRVKGDLRKTFGNPTPIALVGFLLSLTPLACDLMGWRGAGGTGAASTGAYFFFGAFWLTFGATLVPSFNAYGAYVTDPAVAAQQMGNPGNPAGLQSPAFNASFAFFLVFMSLICFVFLICSLRTNIAFFIIFLTLVCAFGCLAGAYFNLALVYANPTNLAAATRASRCVVAGGAFTFVTSLAGWWIFLAIMLASLDFPVQIPVGDLSTLIKGASDQKAKVSEA